MKQLELSPAIESTLSVLVKQSGYVGIGVSTGAAAIPAEVLAKFNFDENGNSTNTLAGTFDFSTVTGERRIEWTDAQTNKPQHSYVLEGVTVTSGQSTFQASIPYEGFLQMKQAGDANATFTVKRSTNASKTRTYYSVRLAGLKAETTTATTKPQVTLNV